MPMKVESRHRPAQQILSAVFIIWVCVAVCQATERTNVLRVEIDGFSCSNEFVSHALALLSQKAPIPINCIIDTTEEVRVSISHQRSRLDDLLKEILQPMTNYEFQVKSNSVLVFPRGLFEDKKFPLNQVIANYDVTYIVIGGTKSHGCIFSRYPNVSTPSATFDSSPPPNYREFPVTRQFENETLLEILTTISSEWRESWACGRVRPDFMRWYNERLDQFKSPDVHTWWPNESAPGYAISWGEGAFHGEYAYITQTKDERGKVHLKKITVQEVKEKEEKLREEGERFRHFDTVREQVVRGMKNREPSPVQVQAAINTTGTSNHTSGVALTLTITNTTTNDVRFPNPYLGVLQQAFWDIRVDMKRGGYEAQYQTVMPSTGQVQEPGEVALAPQTSTMRVLEILGAKVLRDDIYSNKRFPGDTDEKLDRPGKYSLFARLYFKAAGAEYCVWSGPVDFEIR